MAGLAASPLAAGAVAAGATEERILLWPGLPPGAPKALPKPKVELKSSAVGVRVRWLSGIDLPWLAVRHPEHPNGAAAIVIPGGGYRFLSWDREGEAPARWLTGLGVTVFILAYRLPGEGWAERATAPLADAQRALRLVRAHARRYAIDPARIAALGFSAGGHLAASLATRHGERLYRPMDATDRIAARPDLAALLYPVISMVESFAHVGSRDALLGPDATVEAARTASVETRVGPDMPPSFLAHGADDTQVPPANSIAMFEAIRAAGGPAALHLFEDGGHGFGLHLPETMQAAAWPQIFERFAARHGFLAARRTP
ncbi:acetyl esterase/lipase [Sphingomonas naasensis]|uniref:alpha/beta hydrolase n=1 Tax=Sphingomonas naasensis TaxID=1344951 RepID=UPI001F101BF1|nr:alpha/beta hydrolase [Sphingomonas naasensis]NIJ20290.1 acetyl esterase/lipase [Sphingomonas naasensis]